MLLPKNKAFILCSKQIDIKSLAEYLNVKENIHMLYTDTSGKDIKSTVIMPKNTSVIASITPQIYITDILGKDKIYEIAACDNLIKVCIDLGEKEISGTELQDYIVISGKDTESVYKVLRDNLFLWGALV